MALWLQEGQRVKVHKLENKGNYSQANLSSSRKNMNGDGYNYSDWGFVRFVGKAHEYLSQNVKEGDILLLNKAQFVKESYKDAEGNKKYPKNPQLVVFSCELYRKGDVNTKDQEDEVIVPMDDDSIPF